MPLIKVFNEACGQKEAVWACPTLLGIWMEGCVLLKLLINEGKYVTSASAAGSSSSSEKDASIRSSAAGSSSSARKDSAISRDVTAAGFSFSAEEDSSIRIGVEPQRGLKPAGSCGTEATSAEADIAAFCDEAPRCVCTAASVV